MTEQLNSPVTRLLDAHAIEYGLIEIPLDPERKPVRSLEQLMAGLDRDPGQIVRSLLFRCGSGQFALLAVAGGGRADWGVLRKQLDERRLTMAQADEVLQATGYPIGAVPPIALPEAVRVLVDETVFDHGKVVIGSGVLGYALDVAGTDLRKVLADAETGHFVKL
ncbi:aminoacyl-tRNA deacylase [Methylomarinum vadi]|uniref:aminoacyl-tRNA deacylase n=1 Tax=Methylomarinum vadi TaxID=438855 RepID=UPI0004DFA2A0|nr:YbaK/EbsC family protein [Methylomarinum vadi]